MKLQLEGGIGSLGAKVKFVVLESNESVGAAYDISECYMALLSDTISLPYPEP